MSHYGRFYRSALNGLLQRINTYLVRWAKRKYKQLRSFRKVRKWRRADRQAATPVRALGMGDRFQVRPVDGTSGATGDCHAPFCGKPIAGIRLRKAVWRSSCLRPRGAGLLGERERAERTGARYHSVH